MKNQLWFLFVGLAMAIVFTSTSSLYAAPKVMLKKNSISKFKSPGPITGLPDLVVKNASWSSNPKEGDTVGASSSLNIIIWNKGKGDAGASKLRITCKSLTGTNYPYPLDGQIEVQPLGAGQSITYAWPPSSSEKWFPGTYKMDFIADHHFNLVKESNEINNTRTLTFSVLSKTSFLKKIKKKPVAQLQVNTDLEVVSVSISPTNPASDDVVTVIAQVRNSGQLNTPKVDAMFGFGGSLAASFMVGSPSIPPLVPGQTFEMKAITTIITLGESAHVSAQIDKFNKFHEINETNNIKMHGFKVQCKPELALYDYRKTKPNHINIHGKKGKEFTETIWVYNNSGCPSKAAKMKITGPGIVPEINIDIPSIGPINKVGLPVKFKFQAISNYNCNIIVDSTNTNNESIENNNEMTLIANITE